MKPRAKKTEKGLVLFGRIRDGQKAKIIQEVYNLAELSQQAFLETLVFASMGSKDPVVLARKQKLEEAAKKIAASSFNTPEHHLAGVAFSV